MPFMTTYTWEPSHRNAIVKRRIEKGTMLPEGVKVLGERTDLGGGRGFLLLEGNDPVLFIAGTQAWSDRMKMESVPVIDTGTVMKVMQSAQQKR